MASERLVAIHQPNFLPWLGYFDKIMRSDVFVMLDDAQFPRTGGTWTNRVRILVAGQPAWVTVPVDRSRSGPRNVAEMQIKPDRRWPDKALATFRQEYIKSPFFDEIFPLVKEILESPTPSLVDYNMTGLRHLLDVMGIPTHHLVLASDLGAESTGTERLADLVNAVDGTAYLAGGGAEGYQDDDLLRARGIVVCPQEFVHPTYRQRKAEEFVPGLSIIDALFNVGPAGVTALMGACR